jgi:hypothetical protein
MVQAEMTHQSVADHFNVSKITISRLMIRLQQTGRTNDRPRNCRILHQSTNQTQCKHRREFPIILFEIVIKIVTLTESNNCVVSLLH